MTSTRPLARLAGLLYLLASIPGFYGLIYVPSRLIVSGNAAATAQHLQTSATFFRSGVVADLLGQAGFILVALVLYRLLKGVDRMLAALMVILLVVQVPLAFLAEVGHLNALHFLGNSAISAAFSEEQRNALVMAALTSYSNAMKVNEIFMGLWLWPLAFLIYKSGFLPRFLGVLLILAGSAYVAESVVWLLLPAQGPAVSAVASPLRALELALPLWLLIVGAKDQRLPD